MLRKIRQIGFAAAALLYSQALLAEARVEIHFPLNRKVYQTNEAIPLAIVRSSSDALAAGELALSLAAADGSKSSFAFPAKSVAKKGDEARHTEHLVLNGWLLRPGPYTMEASVNGVSAKADIEIYTHIRKSSFRLGDWASRAEAALQRQNVLGEDSVGFNIIYYAYGGIAPDQFIRAGVDIMRGCAMGGGHQPHLRLENDWSDPYVICGVISEGVRTAFADRVHANTIGVHGYDEPGLTWWQHPKTGEMTPHNIPAQDRSYLSAFGMPALQYCDVDPKNPEHLARWYHWGRWKQGFLEAMWRLYRFQIERVRQDFLTPTQSVYGWYAYADGYYWNVVRSLPIISGHGGYDDGGSGYLFTSYTYEFGRARDLNKPNWYLPMWYGGMPANRFRLEHYLAFMNNVQGLFKPPDHTIHRPSTCAATADGIVEANRLLGRLGTIFTVMPVTRPPAAVLYSMSQNLYAQVQSGMKDNYEGGKQRGKLHMLYLASKLCQCPLFPVVEEDVLDGTLAANHRAVVLVGIDYLEPQVAAALEAFASQGGAVIVSDDCGVALKGARKLGAAVATVIDDECSKIWETTKDFAAMAKISATVNYFRHTLPLAKALQDSLAAAGIAPVFTCDSPYVAASRQAWGDIEYIFAVNIATDPERGRKNDLAPLTATIALPDDGRPIYDAILSAPAAEFKKEAKTLKATLRFGPGQMRVFCRTARPIGKVQALAPTLLRDFSLAREPIRLEIGAALLDNQGQILAGAAPLYICVYDPLGSLRYELYRATDKGIFKASLPLAANDPAGEWRVFVRELLSGAESTTSFAYHPASFCAAAAGVARRAIYFGNERENIYRFFRLHRAVTIVKGKSDYCQAAAERLQTILKPWFVECSIVDADEAAKPRDIPPEAMATWCGLGGMIRQPEHVRLDTAGSSVRGPAIVLGHAADNALLKHIADNRFLPFAAIPGVFPGVGRGYLAWQLDAIGAGQESITLIAHDAEGMAEAVGTLYEIAAGLEPLMAAEPPVANSIAALSKVDVLPVLKTLWQAVLPDRVAGMKAVADTLVGVSQDGTVFRVNTKGEMQALAHIAGGEDWFFDASSNGQRLIIGASHHVVLCDSAGKILADIPLRFQEPGQKEETVSTATFVAMAVDGSAAAVGATNGRVLMFDSSGKQKCAVGGVTAEEYAKWQAALKDWEASEPQRQKERDAYKAARERWQAEVKAWEATDRKEPRPQEPPAPQHPPRPTEPRPDAYIAAAFANDGKTLVAITGQMPGGKAHNQLHLLNAADGAFSKSEGGLSGSRGLVRASDNFLVTDSQARVALFSPAEGRIVKQISLTYPLDQGTGKPPKQEPAGVYAIAAHGQGAVIGSEMDCSVRCLATLEGEQDKATAWQYKDMRRIVKYVSAHNDVVAVTYWGGHLVILDAASGKARFCQTLPQDVAAMAWLGDILVCALADGRIWGLAQP